MNEVNAPWTDEQVAQLNAYQHAGSFHPYTCGCGEILIATPRGWHCKSCRNNSQVWAYEESFSIGAKSDPAPEIDHEWTGEVVCPYCGAEQGDSWEWASDAGEEVCGMCENTFTYERDFSVTYVSYRKVAQ